MLMLTFTLALADSSCVQNKDSAISAMNKCSILLKVSMDK